MCWYNIFSWILLLNKSNVCYSLKSWKLLSERTLQLLEVQICIQTCTLVTPVCWMKFTEAANESHTSIKHCIHCPFSKEPYWSISHNNNYHINKPPTNNIIIIPRVNANKPNPSSDGANAETWDCLKVSRWKMWWKSFLRGCMMIFMSIRVGVWRRRVKVVGGFRIDHGWKMILDRRVGFSCPDKTKLFEIRGVVRDRSRKSVSCYQEMNW